jgi:hypothetical protein
MAKPKVEWLTIGDGKKVRVGNWVRTRHQGEMMFIDYKGEVISWELEESGKILLWLRERGAINTRPTRPEFCKKAAKPAKHLIAADEEDRLYVKGVSERKTKRRSV